MSGLADLLKVLTTQQTGHWTFYEPAPDGYTGRANFFWNGTPFVEILSTPAQRTFPFWLLIGNAHIVVRPPEGGFYEVNTKRADMETDPGLSAPRPATRTTSKGG